MSLNVLFDNGNHKIETSGRLPNEQESARMWRDAELLRTDSFAPVTDHPKHSAILAYRQELRDWPNTPEFPTIKPVSPI